MGMTNTIDEIIKKENEIAAELQKVVDTHIVNDNGFTIEEMYCDDTEVIEEELKKCQELADYHNQIADTMRKYRKIQAIIANRESDENENAPQSKHIYMADAYMQIREVLEDGNVD